MLDVLGYWGKELASIWTNYLPPSRPSWSELVGVYTKYLRRRQADKPKQRLSLLVLGSSSEFRDWGYLENLRMTVVDFSYNYHHTIKQEMTYKNVEETFVNERWQDITFESDFDLIVGDLVIGNLLEDEVSPFLNRIARALKPGGYFLTKSFFWEDGYIPRDLKDIFEEYMREYHHLHPFPILAYEVTIACTHPKTRMLDFQYMYKQIERLHKKGVIDEKTFSEYTSLGWQGNMKFKFYVPKISEWENMVRKSMTIVARERGRDVYSEHLPVYVLSHQ